MTTRSKCEFLLRKNIESHSISIKAVIYFVLVELTETGLLKHGIKKKSSISYSILTSTYYKFKVHQFVFHANIN